MKGFLLILLFFAFACGVVAQRKVSFGYDASGNRISRTLLLTRCAEEVCDTEAYHEEIADAYDVRIFPNSDGKRVRVIVSAITSGKVRGTISVYTNGGVLVAMQEVSNSGNDIDLGNCSDGVYLLNITVGKRSTTWKIVKG